MLRIKLLFNHLRKPQRPQYIVPIKGQQQSQLQDGVEQCTAVSETAESKENIGPKNPNGSIAGLVALLIASSALFYHPMQASGLYLTPTPKQTAYEIFYSSPKQFYR